MVAHIGQGIAQALHYAHTLISADGRPFDIVHRDSGRRTGRRCQRESRQ
jgi:hypothetical protein